MWPFWRKAPHKTIFADITNNTDGSVNINVRGQTCPGYLLSINKAMDSLEEGKKAYLITTYAPCGDDIKAWCNERGYTSYGIVQEDNSWKIAVTKDKNQGAE